MQSEIYEKMPPRVLSDAKPVDGKQQYKACKSIANNEDAVYPSSRSLSSRCFFSSGNNFSKHSRIFASFALKSQTYKHNCSFHTCLLTPGN